MGPHPTRRLYSDQEMASAYTRGVGQVVVLRQHAWGAWRDDGTEGVQQCAGSNGHVPGGQQHAPETPLKRVEARAGSSRQAAPITHHPLRSPASAPPRPAACRLHTPGLRNESCCSGQQAHGALEAATAAEPRAQQDLLAHSHPAAPIWRHQEGVRDSSSASICCHSATLRPWPWHSSGKESPQSLATRAQSAGEEHSRTTSGGDMLGGGDVCPAAVV